MKMVLTRMRHRLVSISSTYFQPGLYFYKVLLTLKCKVNDINRSKIYIIFIIYIYNVYKENKRFLADFLIILIIALNKIFYNNGILLLLKKLYYIYFIVGVIKKINIIC